MAKNKKNGGAPPEYKWPFDAGARLHFTRDTHGFQVDKSFNGKNGVAKELLVESDGSPEVLIAFDEGGICRVHPDDCEVLEAGNERSLTEERDAVDAAVEAYASKPAPKPVPTDAFEMGEVSRDCPVPLAPEVFSQKAQRLASIPLDIAKLDAKLSDAKQLHKELTGGLEGERKVLEAEVRDNAEMKPVLCKWIGDPRDMSKKLVRTDVPPDHKDYIVETHILTSEELQAAFDFDHDDDAPIDDEPEAELGGSDEHDGDAAQASAH